METFRKTRVIFSDSVEKLHFEPGFAAMTIQKTGQPTG
jgi:hypothetical protein